MPSNGHTPGWVVEAQERLSQQAFRDHLEVEKIAADENPKKAIQTLSIMLLRERHQRNFHAYKIEIELEAERRKNRKTKSKTKTGEGDQACEEQST